MIYILYILFVFLFIYLLYFFSNFLFLFPAFCVSILSPLTLFLSPGTMLTKGQKTYLTFSPTLSCWPCFLSFSLTLCFTVLLSVFLFSSPPVLLSASSSSPLGFSLVERLSSEGNDRVTTLDGAECFGYRRVKQTHNLCVRNTHSF